MEKKTLDYMTDAAALICGGPVGWATMQYAKHKAEQEQQALQVQQDNRREAWAEFTEDLIHYRLQDRKAIMFLSNCDIYTIWTETYPGDCQVKYLPYSCGLPKGITVEGRLETGVLYVYDPRNETHYYPASDISQVLIKDKFREMKQVFEALGATQIDITFSALKDETNEWSSADSEKISGHYAVHNASASHSGSRGGTNHSSDFRQLEIHKRCTGSTSHVNLNNCYWYQSDNIFRSEVQSIKSGSTLETSFVDITQSYTSMTATNTDKIEAEYNYMESIGVSGMIQWDSSTKQEMTQTLVWDVHIVCANAKHNPNNYNKKSTMTTWKDFFNPTDPVYEAIDELWNYFDKGLRHLPDDVAQSNWEILDEMPNGDNDCDSIINMFRAITGLTNDNFQQQGLRAIKTALQQNRELNHNDKHNLLLAYAAKEADSLNELEEIINSFKSGSSNWNYINQLFSHILHSILDGDFGILGYDDNSSMKDVRNAYEAYRLISMLPSAYYSADGYLELCDLCISKNNPQAYNHATTAYKKYHTMALATTEEEAWRRNTVTCMKLGRIIISLARCHSLGLGTAKDDDTAFRLFKEAYDVIQVETSNNVAAPYLAECYALGTGTSKDVRKAIQMYQEQINYCQEENEVYARKADAWSKVLIGYNEMKIEEYQEKIRLLQLQKPTSSYALTSAEQEYLDEYRDILAEGEIRDRDRRTLDRIAQRNGISPSRAQEIERMA